MSFIKSISLHAPPTVPGDYEMVIEGDHNVWVHFSWDGGQASTDISPERYMEGVVEEMLKKAMRESQEVFKTVVDSLYANAFPVPGDNTLDILVKIVALTSDEEKDIFETRLKERNILVHEVSLDIENLGEIKVHMLGEDNVLPTT